MKPHHIALKVSDIKICERFYRDILGLVVISRQQKENGQLRAVWFDLDGTILMIELIEDSAKSASSETGAAGKPEKPGWHVLALDIDANSRTEWKTRLIQTGVEITGESPYSIYFCDPENNRLALSHYPAAHSHSQK